MLPGFLSFLLTLLKVVSIVERCYNDFACMDSCGVALGPMSEASPIASTISSTITSTITSTRMTPPESTSTLGYIHPIDYKSTEFFSSVPWPGHTFIITTADSPERAITLIDGRVVLAPLGSRGSIRWECVENKGWLGFRDRASGRYLGHDLHGKLRCVADKHNDWERFSVRHKPEGGYVLFLRHWENLWPVNFAPDGEKELWKTEAKGGHANVWKFTKC